MKLLELSSTEIWNIVKHHEIDRKSSLSMAYGSNSLCQQTIDEEGCGIVFCSVRLVIES